MPIQNKIMLVTFIRQQIFYSLALRKNEQIWQARMENTLDIILEILIDEKKRWAKHRYVFFVGNKKDKKNLLSKLNYQIAPYPKASEA